MPTAQQVLDLLIESGEPASAAHELASEYGNALAAEVAADHHHQADDFVGSLRAFDLH